MRRLALIVLAVSLAAVGQTPAMTTVSDTYYGGAFSLVVQPAATFVTADGVEIQPFFRASDITATGAFTIALPPNAGSTPANSYYIAYFTSSRGSWTETWIVPASGLPVNLLAVRALRAPSPSYVFAFAQILPPANCDTLGGIPSHSALGWTCVSALVNPATTEGDILVQHNGSLVRLPTANPTWVLTSNGPGAMPSWQPAGAAAGVASFNGRTGTVLPQTGDYAFSQVSGQASLPQLPTGPVGAVLIGQGNSTPPAYVSDPEVQGLDAAGAVPTGSPVLTGGWDGTDVRTLLTDSGGRQIVNINGTVPVNGTITANLGTLNGAALDATVQAIIQAQASTTAGEKGPLVQGAVTTSSPSYTAGQTDPLSITPAGALRVDASATTQPVSIAILPSLAAGSATIGAVDQAGSWNVGISGSLPAGTNLLGAVNLSELAGVNLASPSAYGTAASGEVQGVNAFITNVPSVAQSGSWAATVSQATGSSLHADIDNFPATQPVSGTVAATESGGPWTVAPQPTSASAQGATPFLSSSLTAATTIDSSAGNLFAYEATNSGTAACYVEFFNAASGS